MTEEAQPNEVPNSEPGNNESSAATQNTEHMIPKSRFDEVNNRYKELAEKFDAIEKERAAQREKELAEQNQWRTLYEESQSKLSEMETVSERAERLASAVQATNEARISQIPEDKRALIPDYDDPVKLAAWLDRAGPQLMDAGKPLPPPGDGGAGSNAGRTAPPALSAEQRSLVELAKASGFNVNDERIAARNKDKK
jgi:hypothetical protein